MCGFIMIGTVVCAYLTVYASTTLNKAMVLVVFLIGIMATLGINPL